MHQVSSTASTVYLTDKNNIAWITLEGVDYFTHHEVGRIVESAYPSLNINRFKADSLYGTLDYHLLKTTWDSSTLGDYGYKLYTSLTAMIFQSA